MENSNQRKVTEINRNRRGFESANTRYKQIESTKHLITYRNRIKFLANVMNFALEKYYSVSVLQLQIEDDKEKRNLKKNMKKSWI